MARRCCCSWASASPSSLQPWASSFSSEEDETQRPLPLVGARYLAGGDVQAVPEVDIGDGHDECGQLLLVEMVSSLVPDVVGDRVGAVAEPGHGFCQLEGGALGASEEGCVP